MSATPRSERANFADQARRHEAAILSALSYEDMTNARRLSGYCLVPAGARALCYSRDPALRAAFEIFKPSLDWRVGDDQNDLDLIVSNGILQKTYTRGGQTMRSVRTLLTELMARLKQGGRIVLRENALLIPEQVVLLELPDHRAKIGDADPSQATIARLFAFAKAARSWLPSELQGFFVEEVPGIKPHTRLFRLPLKWATEFILRKDLKQDAFEASFDQELILGSERLLRTQLLNPLGLRVVLSAPHWDNLKTDTIKGTFTLYSDDGTHTKLPLPATEIVMVVQKIEDQEGMSLSEQRTHEMETRTLSLTGMQNVKTGDTLTVVTGLEPETQIFPWCRLPDGKLGVFLRTDIVRPMVNALPRSTQSIDGRRFSSHIATPLSMDMEQWDALRQKGKSGIASWLLDRTGLRIAPYSETVEGKMGFPAPDFIDQPLGTVFVEVRRESIPSDPELDCYDASDVLQAIHAGLLPSATLEAHMWELARHAQIDLIPLTDRDLEIDIDPDADDSLPVTDFEELCRRLAPDENAEGKKSNTGFREVRGHTGEWRVARSMFVEESARGPERAYDQEFVINDGEPLHRAALMCLSRRLQGDTLAGFELADCPVPTRYGKPGKMIRVPSIPLPAGLKSIPEARDYIAKQLEISADHVVPCGEAVYTHMGVTPQKIFPFLITRSSWFKHYNYALTPLKDIRRLTQLDNHYSILWYWGAFMAFLGDNTEFTVTNSWEARAKERESLNVPDMVMRPVA